MRLRSCAPVRGWVIDGLFGTDSETARGKEPMTGMWSATQRTASRRRARRAAGAPAVVLILALALAGCDTSTTVRQVDGTPDPETEEQRRGEYASHEEFRNQDGLARIKAHYAYARGATGEGVTLGIVDSGVDPDHPKFEGKLEASYVGDYDPDFGTCDEVGPDGTCFSGLGHGTLVAGIMAAARQPTPEAGAASGPPIHGVAFDARVISVGVGSRDLEEVIDEIVAEYPENPTPEQIEELQARVLDVEAQLERELERDTGIAFSQLNGRVTAVNCSFGVPGNIEDFDAQELRERFPNAIDAMAQSDTAAAERTIYVWAAGNAHGEIGPDGSPVSASSVEPLPGLSVRLPELRGHSLAVVATNPDGTIADFSNRCGIAKAFCLAAPGVDITGPAPAFHCEAGASQCFITLEEAGTSSAAPFVTGGIGLLAQHFRNQLGNDEIVERILATADRTGVYADADVYGQGFLDLDTATRPVGGQRMLTGVSLSGASSPEAQSALYLGPAFGDSLARGLASAHVDGTIADFSNRCGIAKAFCLAAPGVDITGPAPAFHCEAGASQCFITLEEAGTSSAAPFVTGGIGLLAQHFRNQLGNDEIVERILATADRTGVYADADVYGQGFLDLDTATRPVGGQRMLTGVSLSGASSPEAQSALYLGPAFGDSLARGLASAHVASFDELDAPFFRRLGDYLRPAGFAGSSLADRLRALGRDPRGTPWEIDGPGLQVRLDVVPAAHGADVGDGLAALASLSVMHDFGSRQLEFGYRSRLASRFGPEAGELAPGTFADAGAFANPYLGFARDGTSLGLASPLGTGSLRIAAFAATGPDGGQPDARSDGIAGALTEYRFGGLADLGLALQAGWMSEANGAVGSRPEGAFGELGTGTILAGLSASRRLGGNWALLGSAHAGTHRTENVRQGIVREVSGLWSGAFALGAVGRDVERSGDRLAFRLSQPLRVEAGHAELRWVSGRSPGGGVEIERADVGLEPSGRQLDLEVAYSRPWAGGRAHMAAVASHDAGHAAGEREVSILARYSRRF